MIPNILNWAKEEVPIRAVILTGSRAENRPHDELSDYDLSIFTQTYTPFIKDESWLASIGQVWVCIHETIYRDKKAFPTRLVIFEGGIKVDFAFFTLDILDSLIRDPILLDDYNLGYKVLLDKDHITDTMPRATLEGFKGQKPTEKEFTTLIKEFWFEAYHVAKYLTREDLWAVKFRSSLINNSFLLKMIEWNEQAKKEWQLSIPATGKRIGQWVNGDTYLELEGVFAHFNREDSWKSLLNTIHLFRRLALETANQLNFVYPTNVDHPIYTFILNLKIQSN